MNQDQVKDRLLKLEPDIPDFSVIFSGKQSKKVNGLYYPESHEIIIHNQNFANDNDLLYTAIHEFAHHVHFSRATIPITSRPHTIEFRSIFHELLDKAEQAGIYTSIFDRHPDFQGLTRKIREQFLAENGKLMKELGRLLVEAESLCREHRARFEDYIERVLLIDRRQASGAMKVFSNDVDPRIGFDNMKTVASIRDSQTRAEAQQALLDGKSPDSVRAAYTSKRKEKEQDPAQALLAERDRIHKAIESMQERLRQIEDRIDEMRSL